MTQEKKKCPETAATVQSTQNIRNQVYNITNNGNLQGVISKLKGEVVHLDEICYRFECETNMIDAIYSAMVYAPFQAKSFTDALFGVFTNLMETRSEISEIVCTLLKYIDAFSDCKGAENEN